MKTHLSLLSENKPEVSVGSLVIHALTCDIHACETAIGHLCLLSDSEDCELGSHDVSGFSQTLDFSQKPESVSSDFCFGFGLDRNKLDVICHSFLV